MAPGIQTIPSRLSCTTRFCLLWRLVKSWNLWVATSLPVSAVLTAVSARQYYNKIFESVVVYALVSVYLLCARTCGLSSYQSCLESTAPGFAKGWQRALAFTIVKHSVGEFSCQPGPVYCLVRLPTGLNICELVWTHNVYLRLQIWSTEGNSDNTTLERPVELTIVDFGFWYWPIICDKILLLLTRKQHWNPNGAPFQCWFPLTWSGRSQERRINPETKVGSSTEQFSSKWLCLYWS